MKIFIHDIPRNQLPFVPRDNRVDSLRCCASQLLGGEEPNPRRLVLGIGPENVVSSNRNAALLGKFHHGICYGVVLFALLALGAVPFHLIGESGVFEPSSEPVPIFFKHEDILVHTTSKGEAWFGLLDPQFSTFQWSFIRTSYMESHLAPTNLQCFDQYKTVLDLNLIDSFVGTKNDLDNLIDHAKHL